MLFHSFFFFSGVLDYPIASIEDPFDKEDWEHSKLFCSLGLCQVCFFINILLVFRSIERRFHPI